VIVFPNCKINLGLQILRKRPDGYHDLQTVFYPLPIQDALEIVHAETDSAKTSITVTGLEVDAEPQDNICLKAYYLLKNDFPDLPQVKIHLHKIIPIGAGTGGGSADGAFTLMLLNKKFNLKLDENRLISYAKQLGSDCPFFIRNKPSYATGRGEIMEDIQVDLSGFGIILINPGIHVSTKDAFASIVPNDKRISIKDIVLSPVPTWKGQLQNDFENSVFDTYNEIKAIKENLYQQGAIYASMTGSGSSVFGIFEKNSQPAFDFPKHYFTRHL
jgi:4-diphosphocytidyl-2-C-methyl-D-erythritol kinase